MLVYLEEGWSSHLWTVREHWSEEVQQLDCREDDSHSEGEPVSPTVGHSQGSKSWILNAVGMECVTVL